MHTQTALEYIYIKVCQYERTRKSTLNVRFRDRILHGVMWQCQGDKVKVMVSRYKGH